eukprot:gene17607-biopygen17346
MGGWDGRLVQLFNDGIGGSPWWDPVGTTEIQKKCTLFWHFGRGITYKIRVLAVSQFITSECKRPGESGLRAAIRTPHGARSGRANDTDARRS